MSNYSENESSVRVDFFKSSGKWYMTKAIDWTGGYKNCCIHEAFEKSLFDNFGNAFTEFDAVCIEPYHEHSHPIQRKAKTT